MRNVVVTVRVVFCGSHRKSTDRIKITTLPIEQLVPRKEYREWVSLFVKGIPLDPSLLVKHEPAPEPDEAAQALNQVTTNLTKPVLNLY